MKYSSESLFMVFVLKSTLSDISIATPSLFSCPLAWNICFQSFSFSLCMSFVLRWVSVGSVCMGHVFLPIQLFCVFWLRHLIHLRLRLLLICTYSSPIFRTYVPLSFTVFLPVLKANPLTSPAEQVWRRYILWGFFCLGTSLFGLPF